MQRRHKETTGALKEMHSQDLQMLMEQHKQNMERYREQQETVATDLGSIGRLQSQLQVAQSRCTKLEHKLDLERSRNSEISRQLSVVQSRQADSGVIETLQRALVGSQENVTILGEKVCLHSTTSQILQGTKARGRAGPRRATARDRKLGC